MKTKLVIIMLSGREYTFEDDEWDSFCTEGDFLRVNRNEHGKEYIIAGFKMAKVESYRKIDYSEVKA